MITPDGRVLLTDFGIAKGLHGDDSDDLTSDNIMMGTAKYLSPEQVRGKKLDGRADLYSLGLVLYECLAGSRPVPRRDRCRHGTGPSPTRSDRPRPPACHVADAAGHGGPRTPRPSPGGSPSQRRGADRRTEGRPGGRATAVRRDQRGAIPCFPVRGRSAAFAPRRTCGDGPRTGVGGSGSQRHHVARSRGAVTAGLLPTRSAARRRPTHPGAASIQRRCRAAPSASRVSHRTSPAGCR